jgi:uncharacterized UBP type Zn finger protein
MSKKKQTFSFSFSLFQLQEMGFERNRAIEAFLACERNKDHAINYLLNSFD